MTDPFNPSTNLAAPWRSFVVIDTETNGLDEGPEANPDPRVLEIAAVRFDNGAVTQRFSSLVNIDGAWISPKAQAQHGIDAAHLVDAPPIAHAWAGILALYEDQQVVSTIGFNGSFDYRYLKRDIVRARRADPSIPLAPRALADPWIDVLAWFRHESIDSTRWGGGRHKLGAVCQRHGVTLEKAHSAEADAIATGELWLRIRERVIACADGGQLADVLRVQSVVQERFELWLEDLGLKPRRLSRAIRGTGDQDHQARMADPKAGAA